MKLTLKDRVLLLNFVLPEFDNRKNLMLKIAISNKIAISGIDQKRIVAKDMGGGNINIGFTDAGAISEEIDVLFTDEELLYLKQLVNYIDHNGMFSEFNLSTYNKMLDEPFDSEEYSNKWDIEGNPVKTTFKEFSPLPDKIQQDDEPVDPNVITEKHIDTIATND